MQEAAVSNSSNTAISLDNVSKRFGDLNVLDSLSFDIEPNKSLAIIGPSGCGKSTLLRLIAGLEDMDSGSISIHGDNPPAARMMGVFGFAFQNPSLFPWRSVEKNVRLPFDINPHIDHKQLVSESLDLVELSEYAELYPAQLSGGMAERTGLARAIVSKPKILLLDEPFRSLDEIARGKLNISLRERIAPEIDMTSTTVLVTHSVAEALYLANTVVMLSKRPARLVKTWSIPRAELNCVEDVYSNDELSSIRKDILKMMG